MTTKRWQGEDEVFFHRRQIKPGTRLVCYGRTNHGEVYIVDEIKTYQLSRNGEWLNPKTSDAVLHLSDDIVLKKPGSNEFRTVSFQSLSYSAIWRLA